MKFNLMAFKRGEVFFAAVMLLAIWAMGAQAAEKKAKKSDNPVLLVANKIGSDIPFIYPQLGHSKDVNTVTITPDGRNALSGSADKTLKLWDLSTGKEVRTFTGHAAGIMSIAITPDGRLALSGSVDKTLKLWDLKTGKDIRTFAGHSEVITSVAITPDGRYALSGSADNNLKLWDLATSKEIRTFTGHVGAVISVAITPDGRYALSGSADNNLKLWDLETGQEVRTFTGHTNKVFTVALTSDGHYALSGSMDNTLKLWDVTTGEELRTFNGHEGIISSLAITPDGHNVLSQSMSNGSLDINFKYWDLTTGQELNTFTAQKAYSGHGDWICPIVITPDGHAFLGSADKDAFKLRNLMSGEEIRSFSGNSEKVTSVALSLNGRFALSGTRHNSLTLWDLVAGKALRNLIGHTNDVNSVAFSPDSTLALSASSDNTIKLWDVTTGEEVRTFVGHKRRVFSVTFSPDGRYALSGSEDKTLKLWEVATGAELRTLEGHSEWVKVASFSPDGHYALSGSWDKTVKYWDLTNGEELRTFTGHTNMVYSVNFSPDGRQAISGSFGKIIIWDLMTGKQLRTFTGYGPLVSSIIITPDDRRTFLWGADNSLKLWDLTTGKELRTFTGHEGFVPSVASSPKGTKVFSGSADGTVRLWDSSTGKEIGKFISFADGEWITITPEGFYNSSENGDKHLNVRIGNNVYGIDQYREKFYRPDIVKLALSGKKIEGMDNIANVKQAPRVSIINTPTTVTKDEVKVTLKITDIGGGIGDIRLYLNGSAVVLDSARGVKISAKDDGRSAQKSYTVKLVNGENSVRAIAFNAENSMQSTDVSQEITATFETISKPSLYAIVIGIDEYKNPKLNLQYAVTDAKLFADTFRAAASSLFETVNITTLTTKEATTAQNIVKELKALRNMKPDDLFVFYVASHGVVDDGEYFLITSNVGLTRTEKLKTDAISQKELKELIANIPTTKKLILLDTCNAGAAGDAIQVAMLTRGMSEDTAMKILSRAVGSTILSAATSSQEALEGYQGHGLFTWVLSEGLGGKAAKGGSGYIKTTDIADYVGDEVPNLAEKVFKRAQYPTISISGQAFPIGQVR